MLKLLIRNPFSVVTFRDDGVGCEEGSAVAEDDDTEEAATAAAVMTEVETATLPDSLARFVMVGPLVSELLLQLLDLFAEESCQCRGRDEDGKEGVDVDAATAQEKESDEEDEEDDRDEELDMQEGEEVEEGMSVEE
ncbi:hypothetical protein BG000_011754 [Podila horticola]|nr:hypothetical protein BG000_011754 [Podila horticola]